MYFISDQSTAEKSVIKLAGLSSASISTKGACFKKFKNFRPEAAAIMYVDICFLEVACCCMKYNRILMSSTLKVNALKSLEHSNVFCPCKPIV